MNYKLLCIFLTISVLKSQDAPQVGDVESTRTVGESEIVTTYESVGKNLNEREILDQLECFKDDYVFTKQAKEVRDEIQELFYAAFDERIPDNKKKVLKFGVDENDVAQLKIVYWRNDTNQYARVFEPHPNPDKKYKLIHRLYRDEMVDNCFRILPDGCSYQGETEDRLNKICKGYDKLAKDLTNDIVELSVNTEMNPANTANQMAECIKEHTKRYTIEMDCAVEGIEMDHSHALEMLRIKKEELENTYVNVQLDEDKLQLTYDEELKTEKVQVEITDEDYQV